MIYEEVQVDPLSPGEQERVLEPGGVKQVLNQENGQGPGLDTFKVSSGHLENRPEYKNIFATFKGTVSGISSDLTVKYRNQFTTVPLQALSDQV